jgi:hypothetical protein
MANGRPALDVWNLETDGAPELIGAYVETVEDTVTYLDRDDGRLRYAPADCVRIVAAGAIVSWHRRADG